jgi:probable rRNA maturation factor
MTKKMTKEQPMKKNRLILRTFDDREKRTRVYWEKLKTAARLTLSEAGIEAADINLIACSDETLRQMKADYFHKDQFTDVIAFPLEQSGVYLEGEIYFSPRRIQENAATFQSSYLEELQRVIIHGVLHLLGYRDAQGHEKEAMTRLEDLYLNKLEASSAK